MKANNVKTEARNNMSHAMLTSIAYAPNKIVDWHCTEPRCKGWDGCIAVFNKKAGTLAVECTLCGHRTTSRLF